MNLEIYLINEKEIKKLELYDINIPSLNDLIINNKSKYDYLFFWDPSLGNFDEELLKKLVKTNYDICHVGLKLGLEGLPSMINYVHPTWMLNKDIPNIEHSSWRLSLKACLIKKEVIEKIGFIEKSFESLDCAGLEFGHRCMTNGVLMRYIPQLVNQGLKSEISMRDELLFAKFRFGIKKVKWILMRLIFERKTSLINGLKNYNKIKNIKKENKETIYKQKKLDNFDKDAKVSILVPTVDRYPYLNTLLKQLKNQTVKPFEVIVVDQTDENKRDLKIPEEFKDLNLKYFYLDKAGQCSSRNFGLKKSMGDYILFLDDDDEVESDLVELHLKNLKSFDCDASCGIANETGAILPENFKYIRVSDVFPTNNTLIRKDFLKKSGLFDLAYEKGQRADGDLGMRIHNHGANMILNPDIAVLHHHAPCGGLRKHSARKITFASSRKYITHRQIMSSTEMYLAKRYFSADQLKERIWLNVFGTFKVNGNVLKKFLKIIVSSVYLPNTLYIIRKRLKESEDMIKIYPQIDKL